MLFRSVPHNRDVEIPPPVRSWSLVGSREDRVSACQTRQPGWPQIHGQEESSHSEACRGSPCSYSLVQGRTRPNDRARTDNSELSSLSASTTGVKAGDGRIGRRPNLGSSSILAQMTIVQTSLLWHVGRQEPSKSAPVQGPWAPTANACHPVVATSSREGEERPSRTAAAMIHTRSARTAAPRVRTPATTSAGAVSGDPASNGGAGAYSRSS